MNKDLNDDLLAIKDQNDVQSFMLQFNIDAQVNDQYRDRVTETTTTVKVRLHSHQLYPYYYIV